MGLEPGTYAGVAFDEERARNATIVYEVALSMGCTTRDAVIGLMTAMQESKFHNYLVAQDHDSLGIFQQRPSTGWGTPTQITDPRYAARKFFERELCVPGREALPLTVVAQTVQRSAFPDAYAQWEQLATTIVNVLKSQAGGLSMADAASLEKQIAALDTQVKTLAASLGKVYHLLEFGDKPGLAGETHTLNLETIITELRSLQKDVTALKRKTGA